jgi:Fringe-like
MPFPSASLQTLVRRGGVFSAQRVIVAALAAVLLLFYFSSSSASHRPADARRPSPAVADELRWPAAPVTNPEAAGDPVCDVLSRGTKDLLVVVNTQAANLYQYLPSRVLTNLRCAPLALYSTVSHKIGSLPVRDALADVAPETREQHKEFGLHSRLRAAQRSLLDLAHLREDGDHNLEKWTVVPALVDAYRAHRDRKWFILIRDDTYLSLPNLLAWLGQLDASVPFYAGLRADRDNLDYASSGEGIILSNAAAAALSELYATKRDVWEQMTTPQLCCGDVVLGAAMRSINVTLVPAHPHMQHESPMTLEWSPHGGNWCKGPVTWNRATPQVMDALWQFERNWTLTHNRLSRPPPPATSLTATTTTTTTTATKTPTAAPRPANAAGSTPAWASTLNIPPILHRDVFEGLILPLLRATSNLTDWDNGSSAHELTDKTASSSYGHSSFETCKYACDIRSKCVQYVHERNSCRMGTSVRVGEPKMGGDRGGLVSGWLAHRAKQLLADGPACAAGDAFFVPDMGKPAAAEALPIAVGELME